MNTMYFLRLKTGEVLFNLPIMNSRLVSLPFPPFKLQKLAVNMNISACSSLTTGDEDLLREAKDGQELNRIISLSTRFRLSYGRIPGKDQVDVERKGAQTRSPLKTASGGGSGVPRRL